MPTALVVISDYYQHLVKMLEIGTFAALDSSGWAYDCVTVPGALEIPAVISRQQDNYQAFIALGCVIRGETSHYELVSQESTRGLMYLSVAHGLAIGNAILTVENEAQAIARADPRQGNKGGGAVRAALAVAAIPVAR